MDENFTLKFDNLKRISLKSSIKLSPKKRRDAIVQQVNFDEYPDEHSSQRKRYKSEVEK